MAVTTQPAWAQERAQELKARAFLPYTEEERERIRHSLIAARRINADKVWPAGTFDALLDKARAEDDAGGG